MPGASGAECPGGRLAGGSSGAPAGSHRGSWAGGKMHIMTDRFDPNLPPDTATPPAPPTPTAPTIEGEFTGIVAITEPPVIGRGNLVVNGAQPFDIDVAWHV